MATERRKFVAAALAAEIRSLAARRNIKALPLSRMTGIPKSTMATIWNGETAIDVDQIAAIAAALDVDPGQLLVDAIANAGRQPAPGPGVHPEDAELVDSSPHLTKRQRDEVKRQLSGENSGDAPVTGQQPPSESVDSAARRRRRVSNG